MPKKHILLFFVIILLLVLSSTVCFASYTSSYPEPTSLLRKGNVGSNVKWVQDMLNHCGYTLSVDGIFGANTHQAITNFQSKHYLQVDGVVGPETISELKKFVIEATSNLTISDYLSTTANVNLRQGPRY